MRLPAFMSFIASIALSLGCSDPASAPPDEPTAVEREVQQRIDAAVEAGFSGAILVRVDGKQVAAEGHGLADRENQVESSAATAFDVGSIMKDLTATVIFALEEDAALAVSDTLAAVLPDVPADKADITLLQILQHRAGFDEFHDTMGDFEPMTELEARERILAQTLLFPPGTEEAYSNSGYTLLADVAQTVSGKPFTQLVRERVFAPAEMDHSGFYLEPVWETVDTAIGYDAETFGDNDPATWPLTWALIGNGGLVTTVVDLDRWLTALWGGHLLGAGAFQAMQDQYLSTGTAELGGKTVYGYAGGGDYGLGGVVIDVPDTGTRVIVATNTADVFDIEGFAVDMATWLLESP
jgi:CubicO group peptidase (beta-lactamase class C family)